MQVFKMLNHVHDNRIVLPYYCHLSNIWLIGHFGFSLQYICVSGELQSFFFIGVMKIVIIGMCLLFKYHSTFVMLFLVPSDELWSANF